MAIRLLRCLARAIAKNGVKFVCSLAPGGEALYEIATDAWEDYRRDAGQEALRAEVQALAVAPANQVQEEAASAVRAEAGGLPPQVRQAIATYLNQVPAAIRRSLRRPSDPSGTTVPPTLRLGRAADLLPLLPARPPRFRPGQKPLLGVDWVLEELVGLGGFGEVWKARHAHLRNRPPVALKFCLDPSAAASLRNEAGVLDQLVRNGPRHGIVPLLNTYLSADPPCLEYAYVDGGDLAGLLRELHHQRQLTPDYASRLLLSLAQIVGQAHRASTPIVHCDLKPANILVKKDTKGVFSFFVTDFGIGGLAADRAARETRQPTRSRQELLTEAVRGAYTPLYASPQQMARRPGELPDTRDDVYALGVIWYQLVTADLGMTSFPTDWRDHLQERGMKKALVELLAACVASRVEKRPANANDLAVELRTALKVEVARPRARAPVPAASEPRRKPVPALPEPRRRRSEEPRKRGVLLPVLGVLLCLLFGFCLIGFITSWFFRPAPMTTRMKEWPAPTTSRDWRQDSDVPPYPKFDETKPAVVDSKAKGWVP